MAADTLKIEYDGPIAILSMNRPEKGNAMSETQLSALDEFFSAPPKEVKAVVLRGEGDHFCAGLDLSEHVARDAEVTIHHSRNWQNVMDRIQFGGLPVVSALSGAVIGGGLELATATHVRVAEPSVMFQLPEGRRGIFVGGGASVRVGRILGADRMTEMMLTGRKYNAEDGVRLGLAHYLVEHGDVTLSAIEIAHKIASNAPMSNYFMIQAVSRINDMSRSDGFFTESLCAALAQTSDAAREGLEAFLEKRDPDFIEK
jgi:(methylthio)acryloyl-CoA hydratase